MSLKISRILHAGYLFECEGVQIAFDPLFENPFSKNCYAVPNVHFDREQIKNLKLSAVFISHYHDDHCSMESLNLLSRETPIYMYCIHDEIFQMIRKLGFKNVFSLKLNEAVFVGPFEIVPLQALDAEVDSIFRIKAGDLNVLNVVDSWIDDEVLEKLSETSWDMILWPFQTMREMEVIAPDLAAPAEGIPHEWKDQLKKLNPRFVVPSSCQFIFENWSWLNRAFFPVSYAQFENEIPDVIRMDPGVSFDLFKHSLQPADRLPWIFSVAGQQVDYEYTGGAVPEPTAEIAKRFPALNEYQDRLVKEFCCDGLKQKFGVLGCPNDPYFQKSRLWQLSVYDSAGKASDFFYALEEDKIEQVPAQNPDWITQIPAFKLYSALAEGESLSSLYVRICNAKFDILEDPLLRCLFNGNFGSYQKAQLRRLGYDTT